MHGIVQGAGNVTIEASGTSAADKSSDGKSAVDDENWFAEVVRVLLPHKSGTILHLSTGLGDERLCQRYAAGHVKPPAYFFRRLLRSKDGWEWLCGAMEGCDAPWWLDVQDAVRIKRAIENR